MIDSSHRSEVTRYEHKPPDRPRRMGWLKPGSAVRCPHGHRLEFRTDMTEDGFLWCKHRAPPGNGPECGARLYAIVHRKRGPSAEDDTEPWKAARVFLVEVHRSEIEYMLQRHMDPDEMLHFLGATYDPAA